MKLCWDIRWLISNGDRERLHGATFETRTYVIGTAHSVALRGDARWAVSVCTKLLWEAMRMQADARLDIASSDYNLRYPVNSRIRPLRITVVRLVQVATASLLCATILIVQVRL